MNISKLGEFGLIKAISQYAPLSKEVIKGIGDDAAVLAYTKDKYQLLTTDMLAQDVHFTLKDPGPLIGQKALACNISDIAAMGGVPTFAVVSLGLPGGTSVKFVKDIYKGMGALARQFGVSIVGGDTIKMDKVIINVALFGVVEKEYCVTRSGAKPKDYIFVTGPLGGSLKSRRHLTFTPRLEQARFLVQHYKPRAMLDISDGLAGDLNHILTLSNVGAELWDEAIPRHKGSTLKQAMTDGEDFELLFTLSPRKTQQLMAWQEKQKSFYFYPIGIITSNRAQTINVKSFTHF